MRALFRVVLALAIGIPVCLVLLLFLVFGSKRTAPSAAERGSAGLSAMRRPALKSSLVAHSADPLRAPAGGERRMTQ